MPCGISSAVAKGAQQEQYLFAVFLVAENRMYVSSLGERYHDIECAASGSVRPSVPHMQTTRLFYSATNATISVAIRHVVNQRICEVIEARWLLENLY